MLAQGGREVQQPGFEADCAGIGHALDDEVTRILERRQRAGVRAAGAAIHGTRGAAAQELMWPLVVVFLSKAVEGALLSFAGAAFSLPVASWLFASLKSFQLPGGVNPGALRSIGPTLSVAKVDCEARFSANFQQALENFEWCKTSYRISVSCHFL